MTGPLARLPTPAGVNVAGFLRSEMGIGEAARGVVAALDAAEVPVMPVHGSYVPGNRQGHEFLCVRPEAAPFPINLICINPEELPIFLEDAGPAFTAGRYSIGFWWWEVEAFPERWIPAFDLLDEVWVGTEHVARNLRQVSPVPVTRLRIPVSTPATAHPPRGSLGLPPGFLFLFMFDYNSIFERKNPLAVVEAFRRAFAPEEGAALVVKSINHGSDPENHARLLAAAAEHPDVHVIGRYLERSERDALLASCDCYVSLHRAEGFGLTAAEAMLLSKPVVATRYSGNLEFMTSANSFLVDYSMTSIQVENPLYPPDGMWADPDVTHAAELMRQVFDRPHEARRRAERGAREVSAAFSPEATGRAMATRLSAIQSRRDAPPPGGGLGLDPSPAPVLSSAPPGAGWRDVARQVSVRRGLSAIRHSPGRRRAVAASLVRSLREAAAQARAPRPPAPSTRSGFSVGTGIDGVELWALLAELRRYESTVIELRSALAALTECRADER